MQYGVALCKVDQCSVTSVKCNSKQCAPVPLHFQFSVLSPGAWQEEDTNSKPRTYKLHRGFNHRNEGARPPDKDPMQSLH